MLISFFLVALYSCGQEFANKTDYPLQVGDIHFDPKIDDPNFTLCDQNNVWQYYNFAKGLQYNGEKAKIIEHFIDRLKVKEHEVESGFLTIRFIVNCKGQTGRYRLQGMDKDYQAKVFNEYLTSQLVKLTKQLDGWIVGQYQGKTYDYYQYLTFKIEKGKLVEIMP